jgi:hypothetical protein
MMNKLIIIIYSSSMYTIKYLNSNGKYNLIRFALNNLSTYQGNCNSKITRQKMYFYD